ncbi:MAG: arsenate reductase [Undibacterium curvum]|uniref:Arsenate reductase n=1 Tax=Undibacterium curvum TaxID=2762294 RepID=A0ABR7A0U2_9BURK|nr:arsenate reductase [Undibacterium curvum]MBC3930457.1 arsenate reductase [Undibacterium curvum]
MNRSPRKITLYGIPNCDTVKKSRVWMQEQHPDFVFHDFKKQGLERATIEQWLAHLSLDVLINRKGTSWRALSEEQKQSASDSEAAIALILSNPSLVKRPVLQISDAQGIAHVSVGFTPDTFNTIFSRF